MKQLEALIAWTPQSWADVKPETAGQVKVGPFPDTIDWSHPYAFTGGACYTNLRSMSEQERLVRLFIAFHDIVVRDGIDPQAAHQAFMSIDEYSRCVGPVA